MICHGNDSVFAKILAGNLPMRIGTWEHLPRYEFAHSINIIEYFYISFCVQFIYENSACKHSIFCSTNYTVLKTVTSNERIYAWLIDEKPIDYKISDK